MELYNTQQGDLILKEYGRNIQKLVDNLIKMDDREKRTRYAHAMIDLMKQISPVPKDYPEYAQKLWDDLYLISGFKLDVDSPYPMPEPSLLGKKPQRLPYTTGEVKYKHYGKHVELMIEKAVALTDPEEREGAIIAIGRIMKGFYASWNKEVVDDGVILDHMKILSKHKLDMDIQKIKENGLFDGNVRSGADNRGDNRSFQPSRNNNQRNKQRQGQGKGNQNSQNRNKGNFNPNKNRRPNQ